jgi:hypothetical protein
LISLRRFLAYYSLFVTLAILMTVAVPIVRASLPIPEIALTRTVYSVGESVAVRFRILTMPGVPTPISGLRLVFNTPAGIMTHNVETINSDTWYTVTITGVTKVSGTCRVVGQLPVYNTSSGTLTFTVRDAEDFSVSASPASVTVKQGEKASFSITVNPVGGFDKSVTLTVTGLPSGATALFSMPSGKLPLGSALTVSVSSSAPEGSYLLVIESSGDTKIRSAKVTLNVERMPSLLEQIFVPGLSTPLLPLAIIAIVAIAIAFTARRLVARRRRPSSAGRYLSPPPPPPVAMKQCTNCGASIPQDARYCGECGATQR